jgi:hypothetical protein
MELCYENIKDENFVHKLNGKIVMDFLSVNSGAIKDWKIFSNWLTDFKSKKVPFVVTETLKTYASGREQFWKTIWVEELAPAMLNGAKEREEIIFDINKCV